MTDVKTFYKMRKKGRFFWLYEKDADEDIFFRTKWRKVMCSERKEEVVLIINSRKVDYPRFGITYEGKL